jgi:nucleoside-diphosphate-sugar epimerase
VLDISLAHDFLGWRPKLSFSAGLGQTLADLARDASLSSLD